MRGWLRDRDDPGRAPDRAWSRYGPMFQHEQAMEMFLAMRAASSDDDDSDGEAP